MRVPVPTVCCLLLALVVHTSAERVVVDGSVRPPAFPTEWTATAFQGSDWIWYDPAGLMYRQDTVAYGSDGTVSLFYCTESDELQEFSLFYPGQPKGPYDPSTPNACTYTSHQGGCAAAFAAKFTDGKQFNPLYVPLGAIVRRGVPDDFVYVGPVDCPSHLDASHTCGQWNYTEPVPQCGEDYRSWFVVDLTVRFPVEYGWMPIWFISGPGGGCRSDFLVTSFDLKADAPIDPSLVRGFGSKVDTSKCTAPVSTAATAHATGATLPARPAAPPATVATVAQAASGTSASLRGGVPAAAM